MVSDGALARSFNYGCKGRVAQRQSAGLTSRMSQVQILSRPLALLLATVAHWLVAAQRTTAHDVKPVQMLPFNCVVFLSQ